MKRLLIPAAALGLALATPALASPAQAESGPVAHNAATIRLAQMEPREQKRDRDRNQETRQPGPAQRTAPPRQPARPHRPATQTPAARSVRPAAQPARPAMQAPPRKPAVQPARPAMQQRPATRPGMHRPVPAQQTRRFDWGQYRPGQRPPDWRQHRKIDRKAWMYNRRAEHRYRWRPYERPSGWYYRRWVFGTILPSLFWPRQYWIDDYWEFGLMDPPYGYVWVRYGDDALLVNVQTGYILQAVYGLFY